MDSNATASLRGIRFATLMLKGRPVRVKTRAYKTWAASEGWKLKALGQHTHDDRWDLTIVVLNKPAGRDVSNYIKPIEDLVCAVCNLEDRNVGTVTARHRWTETDDLVALYLYRFGTTHLGLSQQDISAKLGMTDAALTMRIANFRALDSANSDAGLGNFAAQSQQVYHHHHTTPETALRRLVSHALV